RRQHLRAPASLGPATPRSFSIRCACRDTTVTDMAATAFEQTKTYYRGALTALRFLEERQSTGRRFGPDADLRWASFRGHLLDLDRVDLLIRDADAQWPGSLGPR